MNPSKLCPYLPLIALLLWLCRPTEEASKKASQQLSVLKCPGEGRLAGCAASRTGLRWVAFPLTPCCMAAFPLGLLRIAPSKNGESTDLSIQCKAKSPRRLGFRKTVRSWLRPLPGPVQGSKCLLNPKNLK